MRLDVQNHQERHFKLLQAYYKSKTVSWLDKSCDVGFSPAREEPQNLNYHPSSSAPRTYSPTYSITTYKMPSPAHLISKIGDPIFAVFIGLSAAATRINREEKELGRSTQQTIDAGLRYALQGLYKIVSKLTLLFNRRIGFRQGDASSKE